MGQGRDAPKRAGLGRTLRNATEMCLLLVPLFPLDFQPSAPPSLLPPAHGQNTARGRDCALRRVKRAGARPRRRCGASEQCEWHESDKNNRLVVAEQTEWGLRLPLPHGNAVLKPPASTFGVCPLNVESSFVPLELRTGTAEV